MRRLLIIFLLAILPIQAAMAAACAYCPDTCMSESAAAMSADAFLADAAALDDNDDCGRCQLGAAGILPSLCASRLPPPPAKLSLFENGSFFSSGKPDRPERPNWARAA